MKRILAFILVICIALSAAACTQRPEAAPEASKPQTGEQITPQSPDEGDAAPADPAVTPDEPAAPTETPDAESVDVSDPEPSAEPEPEDSPEPSTEPEPEESGEPKENANEGKVDTGAAIVSTATDLQPADTDLLAYIPELPFEGLSATSLGAGSLMLELSSLPADAQAKLMEYIQDLKDEDFEVTEYVYGSLYDAVKGSVTVTIMLEGGLLSIVIEKK